MELVVDLRHKLRLVGNELELVRRSARPLLALPQRVPSTAGFQGPLNNVVLVRRSEYASMESTLHGRFRLGCSLLFTVSLSVGRLEEGMVVHHTSFCSPKDSLSPATTTANKIDERCAEAPHRREQTCNIKLLANPEPSVRPAKPDSFALQQLGKLIRPKADHLEM